MRKFLPFNPIDRQIILNKLTEIRAETERQGNKKRWQKRVVVTRSLKCDVSSREQGTKLQTPVHQPISPGQNG